MKKLMFATALVASAVAFADGATAINATSFEGYTAGTAVIGTGGGDVGEQGATANYFCYEGDQDGSTVKAYGVDDNLTVPGITRPFFFQGITPNANYLELSTEGGTLWRSINQINSQTDGETTTYSNGDPVAVAATGTYLDTLVQFTPTEDGGAPELTQDDKLAIWLNVDANGVTNLMVRAGYVNDNGTATSTIATNYVLSTTSPVVAGAWYRLTVKAIADVTKCKAKNGEYNPNGITGFEIYLDSVQLAAASTTIADGYIDRATDASEYGWLDQTTDADFITYLQSGKVFPSLKGETSGDSLQSVGFKGSGALDDLVWTTEDPFQGGAGGDDYKVEIGGSDVVITPTAADLAAIAAAAQAAGQTIDVNDKAAVNALLATEIPGSGGVQAWEAAFLGVEPSTNGLEQVAIKSISFDDDGKVVVEMADAIELKTGRGVTINLILKGSDDLTTWTTLQTATDTTEFTAITPAQGETKKFYKVVVEFAATPAQN